MSVLLTLGGLVHIGETPICTATLLPAELRIGTISTGHRRMDKHPLQTVADRFEESVLAFNQHHGRHQVDAREERLEEWLLPLMESRYRDVVALYEGAELTGLSTPTHWEVFLLAVKSSRNPLPGIYATMAKRRSYAFDRSHKLERDLRSTSTRWL